MTVPRRNEDGFALITVFIALTILIALVVTVVTFASESRDVSKRDQNWNAALNSAEAGVDDYLFHLNENSNYTLYSATNPPPDANPAFGGFKAVPGGSTNGSFHYTVDTSALTTEGTVTVTATGKVGTTERTIQSVLRRRNFLDYLYFTDYETRGSRGVQRLAVHADRGAGRVRQALLRGTRHRAATRSCSSRPTRSTARSTPTTPSRSAAHRRSRARRPRAGTPRAARAGGTTARRAVPRSPTPATPATWTRSRCRRATRP